MTVWVREFEVKVDWPFDTMEAAKEYVANEYKKGRPKGTVVLFSRIGDTLLLREYDYLYLIEEETE